MTQALAFILYGIIWLLTLPPLPVLYLIEKPAAWMLQTVFKYRRPIILANLTRSFPEKSGKDLAVFQRDYYRWLVRVSIESLKAIHWSVDRLQQQLKLLNPEALEEFAAGQKDVIILAGHTGNWEWTPGAISPLGFDLLGVYKPQSSLLFNELTILLRKKKQVIPIPMKATLRALNEQNDNQRPRALLLIGDQIPALGDIHFWQEFLHQETAWFTGAEKIAEKRDLPVFYLRMVPMVKGHYQVEYIPLRYPGQPSAPSEITSYYIHALEQTIRQYPAFWLWSHRRWKHQRKDLSL